MAISLFIISNLIRVIRSVHSLYFPEIELHIGPVLLLPPIRLTLPISGYLNTLLQHDMSFVSSLFLLAMNGKYTLVEPATILLFKFVTIKSR